MSNGFFESADLAAGTNTTIYTAPADTQAIASVNFVNRGNVPCTVRLATAASSTPTNSEWIEYETELEPKAILERTGIVLETGRNLVARSSAVNVSVTANGLEMSDQLPPLPPTEEYILTNIVITFQSGNIQFVANDGVTDIKSDLYAGGIRTVTLEVAWPGNTVTLVGLLQDVGASVHYFTVDASGATVDGTAYASSSVYAIGEVSTGGTGTVTFNA